MAHTLTGSTSSDLKSHNRRAVLFALLRHTALSRSQLAAATGLSSSTITNLTAELLAEGFIIEAADQQNGHQRGVGRPQTALRLVPEARAVVGVHFDVDSVRVAVTDLLARPLTTQVMPLSPAQPPPVVLDEIAATVRLALLESAVPFERVLGLGVGVSGLVDPQTGINVLSPNLGWRDVPVAGTLAAALGLPVRADNNVRLMALSEVLFGDGRGADMLAFVYARIGVGAGFAFNGVLYRGAGAGAGEIGHVTMLPDGGDLCHCGNTGCLETLVSEPAILRLAAAAAAPGSALAEALDSGEGTPIERVFAAARAGDRAALDLCESRGRYMGIALANLVNTLNPDEIVLGGLFAQGRDLLLPTVEATVRARAFAGLGTRVRIRPPSFERPGIIGAAALALEAFFYRADAG